MTAPADARPVVLAAGITVGPFSIGERLGAGGMGEVWRARDTRLDRDVALKVLPPAFASDPARVSRFEREAKLLAALNHPAIATVHGFEPVDGLSLLVLELVEGPTLAERLRRGRLRVDEALAIAIGIAEALEAAHEKGIIHRDLKPSNVKLLPDGRVKLLDFGLAKALEPPRADGDVSKLPTDTSPTEAGVVLGTMPYMSPEQARGEPVDERADVWSFGCVLYEMLAGRRAFSGPTTSDITAAVLEREPDWAALPANTPALVRSVLHLCLKKDRRQRLHDIGDARLELQQATNSVEAGSGSPSILSRRRAWLAGVAVVALTATGIAASWYVSARRTRTPPAPLRLHVALPSSTRLPRYVGTELIALSPDGRSLVFGPEKPPDGQSQLFRRRLDALAVSPVAGTEGAVSPLGFSPDGAWLLFGARGKLEKVSVDGGTPVVLCDAAALRGASWGEDGTIVYSPNPSSGLFRVSDQGGTPRKLTEPDSRSESSHRWPQVVRGGRTVLFTTLPPSLRQSRSRIEALDLATGARTVLIDGASYGRYVPTGHLVYASAGKLYAAPFDIARLAVTAPPVPVVDDVKMSVMTSDVAQFAFSSRGLLAYVVPFYRPGRRSLVWVDREGRTQPVVTERRPYAGVSLSPDGRHIVVPILGENGEDVDLWRYDLAERAWRRLTTDGDAISALWAPSGESLAVTSRVAGTLHVFRMSPDGSGVVRLTEPPGWQHATGWAPDGAAILFGQQQPDTGFDIWILPLAGGQGPRPLLASQASERGAVFSPDGRWIAYSSDEGGTREVYVRPYPLRGDRQWRISTGGGWDAVWSPNGREIFYLNGRDFMAAPVTTKPAFQVGAPHALFRERGDPFQMGFRTAPFAVTPDGQRFLMVLQDEEPEDTPQIVVVPDWFEELKAKVPTPRH